MSELAARTHKFFSKLPRSKRSWTHSERPSMMAAAFLRSLFNFKNMSRRRRTRKAPLRPRPEWTSKDCQCTNLQHREREIIQTKHELPRRQSQRTPLHSSQRTRVPLGPFHAHNGDKDVVMERGGRAERCRRRWKTDGGSPGESEGVRGS